MCPERFIYASTLRLFDSESTFTSDGLISGRTRSSPRPGREIACQSRHRHASFVYWRPSGTIRCRFSASHIRGLHFFHVATDRFGSAARPTHANQMPLSSRRSRVSFDSPWRRFGRRPNGRPDGHAVNQLGLFTRIRLTEAPLFTAARSRSVRQRHLAPVETTRSHLAAER